MADKVTIREFDDIDTTRDLIYKNALDAVSKRFPVEDDDFRLELHRPRYTGPQEFSLRQQKDALMKERRLHTPITGTWRLIDKPTGNILEEREDVVMHVPYYTPRGTFINNGNEYSVVNQARLRPGVYIRRQRTGEVEAHFNVRPGAGKPFRIHLEPETGVFKVALGQSSIPLYPLLKAMGVSDQDMLKSWGPELAAANIRAKDVRSLPKLYQRLAGYKHDPTLTAAGQEQFIRESLPNFQLDEDVVARTLGVKGASGVTPEVLMRTVGKMLNVSRGDEQADDRDSPEFSQVLGIEDFVRERIEKDAGQLTKNMLRKVRRGRSLQPVRRGVLNSYIDSLLLGSGLAMPLEETNPLHTLEQLNRITKLGEGGISSAEAITDEARDVNPGQFGFADPISGPEGLNIGIDVRAAFKTFKGSDGKLYAEFKDKAGRTQLLSPEDVAHKTVAFPGQMAKETPYVYAMQGGKMQRVKRETVDVEVPSFGHMMSSHVNLNPMPTAVQAGRQFYGAKFWSQYLPQVEGEVPLVDSLMPDGQTTFSEYYGRKIGTLRSKVAGTVTRVGEHGITVVDNDGKKHVYETVQNFPFNRQTGTSYFPTVKAGDTVNIGDMVAHSNFTDKKTGALNLGRNIKTAILPYAGFSYEDAYTISASAAKKLSTERLYGFDLAAKHGVELGKNKFMASFPRKYTKEQYEKLDNDGVLKPGSVVNEGDPIILGTGPKLLTSADAQLGKLHKVLRNAFTDKSVVWENSWPGEVTDVALTRHGARVNVKTAQPVQEGDKLSTRFGLKGVVSKVIPDDEMPRDAVTNEAFELLLNPMAVLSRVAPNQIMELALGKLARVKGTQFRLPQEAPPEGWASWVTKQLADAGVTDSTDVFDPKSGKTIKGIGDGVTYLSAFHHLAEKKLSSRGEVGSYTSDQQPARGGYEGAKKFCFIASQPISVLHGEDTIGHIVEKKIPALVWAPDDNGVWGYHRVTNWFTRRGNVADVVSVSVQHLPATVRGSAKIAYDTRVLQVTKNHEVYRSDGSKCTVGDLKSGDWLSTYGYKPTRDQLDILIGSMLGDGAVCNLKSKFGAFYHEMHSAKQAAYVQWKHQMLFGLVSNRTLVSNKTWYDGTIKRVAYLAISRPDVVEYLRQLFYRGTKKIVTKIDIAALNDIGTLGLAVWFLDDGSCGEYAGKALQGNIATMGFGYGEVQTLASQLQSRLGGKCTATTAKAIYLSREACLSLANMVAAHIPWDVIPPSKTWLVNYVKAKQMDEPAAAPNNRPELGTIPARVTSICPYVPTRAEGDEINLYDIEVDKVHRYCASDVVVSNSQMDVNAALAHGATDVIKDVMTIRGTKNEEFWKALKLGRPLPEPGVPFIYTKFIESLRAGGINVQEKGDISTLLPMSDDDINTLSKGEVKTSAMLDANFEPLANGLFDPGKTGGTAGNRWTHISLPEPMPNPIMEEPIRRLLGLKVKELEDVVAGRKEIDGMTGGQALKAALDKIDINDMITEHTRRVRQTRGATRDNSIKVLGYLSAAKKQGTHPSKWLLTKVPVIPPMFRPISRLGDVALMADLNELYRDVIESSGAFKALSKDLPAAELADERLTVYNSVRAAMGLGDPITPEGQSKRLKGAIRQIIGTSPKSGLFQSKVISKPVDVVGRGVVTPDPNLDMDQLGIPEDSAWALYKDFVMRALVRRGFPPLRATELIDKRAPEARKMLDDEMAIRPVLVDRAPTWHKFNLLAFFPHISEGHVVRVSPLVTKGFNMDFDGDQVNFHVPVSQKAVDQALRKMLPSSNLFSLTDLQSVRHSPAMEMTFGLFQLTRPPNKKPVRVFASEKNAIEAYRAGELGANDPIQIGRG